MEIIRRSERIRKVPSLFKQTYCHNGEWTDYHFVKFTDKSKQYDALLKATTREEIDKIIGTNSWTKNECHECENDCDITIQVGELPDYESATTILCIHCLRKALEMLENEKI